MTHTFCCGDIHGRVPALIEVLDKCDFDKTHDTLIVLGDIVDGYPWVKECFDILDTIKNKVICRGNHDCLTPDAEILTQRGWLQYTDLILSDMVYSFDVDKNVGTWQPITNIIIKNHCGDMIVTNTNRMKMCVTPTHRVLHGHRRYGGNKPERWSEYEYIQAGKLLKGRIKIYSALSDNNTEYNIEDNIIKLAAWTITDANINKYGRVTYYQSKEKYIEEIKNLLNYFNFTYMTYVRDRDIKEICGVKLKKRPMVSYEFRVCANDSKKIREYITNREDIPNWLYKLSNRQFKIFLDTVINANGTRYNHRENDETSILYGMGKFLKNIQGLLVTKGYTSTFAIDNRGDPRLNICAKKEIEYESKIATHKEFYNGIVWCIETPLTNFMVRYKGTCYFTGNSWAYNWMTTGQELPVWVHQGGYATLRSYDFDNKNVPESHAKMIETSKIYHIDSKNNIYCHGGFNPKVPIENQSAETILWDRTLCKYAHNRWLQKNPVNIEPYKKIFVGHTSTMFFHSTRPLIMGNVIMLDTGGGDIGKLTIMNVDTLEWWQSEKKKP